MNIFIDIETIPAQSEEETKTLIAETISAPATMSKPETIADWHAGKGKYAGVKDAAIEETYRKTSFDGAKGEIVSIAFASNESDITVGYRDLDGCEASLLESAFKGIAELSSNHGSPIQPYFIGQYIGGFDLRFLFQRAVVLGVRPPFKIPFDGRHGKDFYCTQQAWAGFGGRMSQNSLCKALGIEGKPDDIDGSQVWDYVKAGNAKRVSEYNADDVFKNILIYNRLNFIGSKVDQKAA